MELSGYSSAHSFGQQLKNNKMTFREWTEEIKAQANIKRGEQTEGF
jgi:hypothetical protein